MSETSPNIPRVCESCGGVSLTEREAKWGYTLYECSDCMFQFWWPFRNPGHEAYQENERFEARNADPLAKALYPQQRSFLREHRKAGGTLLDLGMGTGRFLAAARDRGYQVTGTDFDKNAVAAAQRVLHLEDVHAMDPESFFRAYPDRRFDVVTLFEVLEHLDSYDFFPLLARALGEGGELVISVPNRDCWEPLLDGEGPPVHLTRWSQESMRRFLAERGFRVTRSELMPLRFDLVVKPFNEWTKGFLSFGAAKRLAGFLEKPSTSSDARVQRSNSFLRRFINLLAQIKMYVLFSIPAAFLYAWITLRGRRGYALYVTAVPER